MPSEHRSERFQAIDALRGAAALAVVLFHCLPGKANPLLRSGYGVTWLVGLLFEQGRYGVPLFFVISGFCIHLRVARMQAAGTHERPAPPAFWKRRFRRLYPAYLAALSLALLVSAAQGRVRFNGFGVWNIVAHLLLIHNLDNRTVFAISGVFWTMAAEEQLYGLYFLLLRLRERWSWAATLSLTLALRVACLVVYLGISHRFGTEVWYESAAFSGWFTWCLGALAAEAAYGAVKLPRRLANPACAGALLLLAMAADSVDTLFRDQWIYHASHASLAYLSSLPVQPLWGLAGFSLVLTAVRAEREGRLRGSGWTWLAGVGAFSYSLYLTHSLFVNELAIATTAHFHGPDRLLYRLAFVPPALLFGWVFYRCFERPFLPSPSAPSQS